ERLDLLFQLADLAPRPLDLALLILAAGGIAFGRVAAEDLVDVLANLLIHRVLQYLDNLLACDKEVRQQVAVLVGGELAAIHQPLELLLGLVAELVDAFGTLVERGLQKILPALDDLAKCRERQDRLVLLLFLENDLREG